MINAALWYAERGYPVFPLVPNGKEPLLRGSGFKDATTDAKQVREWWSKNPNANIGGVCSKFQVLDVDSYHGGDESLLAFPPIPACPEVETPRGGKHFFFAPNSEPLECKRGFRQGLDMRSTNKGYVVLPPSVTPDGKYRWVTKVTDCELPDVPEWLVEELAQRQERHVRFDLPEEIHEGGRNDTLFKWACRLRREGLNEKQIYTTLTVYNKENCKPPISDDDVLRIAHSASRYDPEPLVVEIQKPPEVARSGMIGEFRPSGRKTGVPSGFSIIDDHTVCGGFPDGQLSVILADTNVGKSAMLIQIATNMAKEGLPVCYATFADLGAEDMYDRILFNDAGVHGDKTKTHELLSRLPIYVYDATELMDGRDVRAFSSWFEAHGGRYAAVIIDYAQELEFDSKDRSEYDDARKVTGELRWLAARTKVPFIVASQMTEGNEKAGTKTITKGSRLWQHRPAIVLQVLRLNEDQMEKVEPAYQGIENLTMLYLEKSRFGKKGIRSYAQWSDEFVRFVPL